jgi:hypothetical protein
MRHVTDLDSDTTPRIALSNPVVNFGNAYYKSQKTETIRITNIGDVGSRFCSVLRRGIVSVAFFLSGQCCVSVRSQVRGARVLPSMAECESTVWILAAWAKCRCGVRIERRCVDCSGFEVRGL